MTKIYGISFATDNGKDEDDPNDTGRMTMALQTFRPG